MNRMPTVKSDFRKSDSPATREASLQPGLFSRELFLRLLSLEHKRAERSGRPFMLMLLQSTNSQPWRKEQVLQKLARTLAESTRKTDVKGWYDSGSIIGVMFTEFGSSMGEPDVNNLLTKVTGAIHDSLGPEESSQVKLSYGMYPEAAGAHPRLSLTGERAVHAGQP
jgi:hypothetical protein